MPPTSTWYSSSPSPYLEMHCGPGRGFPSFTSLGATNSSRCCTAAPIGSRCARRAARKAGCAAPISPARCWRPANRRRYRHIRISPRIAGRSAPGMGFTTARIWSPRMRISASPTSLDVEFVVQQAFGTLDNRYIATIGMRHTFMPEWKWFSPTAGIGTGYQYHPGQGAARAAAEQQRDGLRLARRAWFHHPAIHVARRLAPLRRLQQSECV